MAPASPVPVITSAPPSLWSRFSKFVADNKTLIYTIGAATFVVVSGAGVYYVYYKKPASPTAPSSLPAAATPETKSDKKKAKKEKRKQKKEREKQEGGFGLCLSYAGIDSGRRCKRIQRRRKIKQHRD
jgi:hypothetical protein